MTHYRDRRPRATKLRRAKCQNCKEELAYPATLCNHCGDTDRSSYADTTAPRWGETKALWA